MSCEAHITVHLPRKYADDMERLLPFTEHTGVSDWVRKLIEKDLYGRTSALNMLNTPAKGKPQSDSK